MIRVGDITIGEGSPKICAPVVEVTQEDILEEGEKLALSKGVDLIEWRIVFYDESSDISKILQTASLLRTVVGKKPLLATFRTKNEGGNKEIEESAYKDMLIAISESGDIDMVDIEVYFMDEKNTKDIVKSLKKNVVVVGSYHDFDKTPSYDEIIKRLCFMKSQGVSIPKLACMPQNRHDVVTLMEATQDFVSKNVGLPVITMSMGDYGKVSRVAGKSFGSAMTFGCLGKASAPGQINVDDLRAILNIL